MAYIKVDHSKFEAAASAIDAHLREMKKQMNNANASVNNLSSGWQGKDFAQFKAKWDGVNDPDSEYSKMYKSLEAYAKFLRHAAEKYKKAQANAINRANSPPKY